MPFIFLLLFALICLQTHWPRPPFWLTREGCAMLVGTMVLASWLCAGLISKVLVWQMSRHPEQRSSILRRYGRWRRYHLIGLLAAYLGLLYLLGWGYVLKPGDSHTVIPGVEIGLLAPFLIGLILAWERFYNVEQTAYEIIHEERFIPRHSYLLLQIRHQMLLVMPPMLLLLLQQVLFAIFAWEETSYVPTLLLSAMLICAFVGMPILLRIFLGLKPLPAGPLRERLEVTAQRLGFRYSNILLWNTRHLFANAMVTGFVPWVRYIVLTDRLIDDLSPDEIEAVFGHEVGHIKHHHLFFYLTFFLASFVGLSVCWDEIAERVPLDTLLAVLDQQVTLPLIDAEDIRDGLGLVSSFAKLGLLAAYTLLVFGYISRRCERQADLYGAGAVSTDAFISALEKVADINGIPRHRTGNWLVSWQHPSIAERVEFLQEMRDHPGRATWFHLSIRLMQWTLYVGLAGLLLGLWYYGRLDVMKLLSEF